MKLTWAVIGVFVLRIVLESLTVRLKISHEDNNTIFLGMCILVAGWIIGG